jgi:hypothetical protein
MSAKLTSDRHSISQLLQVFRSLRKTGPSSRPGLLLTRFAGRSQQEARATCPCELPTPIKTAVGAHDTNRRRRGLDRKQQNGRAFRRARPPDSSFDVVQKPVSPTPQKFRYADQLVITIIIADAVSIGAQYAI